MIGIQNKADCCGCGVCVQKCPKQCIHLNEDSDGFLYPQVDESSCLRCGVCETVCPFLHPYERRERPVKTLAAVNKDEDVRLDSSSGGVFSVLARQVVDMGGVVFGARYDENWNVVIDSCDTADGVSAFRGSKYVQAYGRDNFKKCELLLKSGVLVLYSGTPCQISALKHFLNREYDNLVTVDFVCHGVPSPKVWRMYVKGVSDSSKICSVSMRNKDSGWSDFRLKMAFVNDERPAISSSHKDNVYMQGFLKDMILRPSCYYCKSKEFRSHSDITLGDFWGVDKVCPELNDDKGISICMIHSEKLDKFLNDRDLQMWEVPYEDIVKFNRSILKSVTPWPRREEFFKKLNRARSVDFLIEKYLKPAFDFKTFARAKARAVVNMLRRRRFCRKKDR